VQDAQEKGGSESGRETRERAQAQLVGESAKDLAQRAGEMLYINKPGLSQRPGLLVASYRMMSGRYTMCSYVSPKNTSRTSPARTSTVKRSDVVEV